MFNRTTYLAASMLALLVASSVMAAPTRRSASSYTISVINNCDQSIWPSASQGDNSPSQITGDSSGSATPLNKGDSRAIQVPLDVLGGRIWARTGCKADGDTGNCVSKSTFDSCKYDNHCQDAAGVAQCPAYGTNEDATLVEFGYSKIEGQDMVSINLSRQPGSFSSGQFNVGVKLTGANDERDCADKSCPVPDAYVNVGEGDSAAMTAFTPGSQKDVTVTFCPSG